MRFCAQPETHLLKENFLDAQLDTPDLECNPGLNSLHVMCHPEPVAVYISAERILHKLKLFLT